MLKGLLRHLGYRKLKLTIEFWMDTKVWTSISDPLVSINAEFRTNFGPVYSGTKSNSYLTKQNSKKIKIAVSCTQSFPLRNFSDKRCHFLVFRTPNAKSFNISEFGSQYEKVHYCRSELFSILVSGENQEKYLYL